MITPDVSEAERVREQVVQGGGSPIGGQGTP